jgi:3-oxoacyl-[acyl-carrier-protein] synthase-3
MPEVRLSAGPVDDVDTGGDGPVVARTAGVAGVAGAAGPASAADPAGTVTVVGLGSYLPQEVVGLDFFYAAGMPPDPMPNSPLMRLPPRRHHVARGERASTMIERAARPMFDRLGIPPDGNVDVLLTNVLLPDGMFTGCGAETADLLGCTPEWIIDLHNGGCASFPYMLKVAGALVAGGGARTALLATVQNTAGQLFSQPEIRKQPYAALPGDGCGVAYVRAGGTGPGATVLGVQTRHTPDTAMDIGVVTADGRRYWEAGGAAVDVKADPDKQKETLALGNRLVPELVEELCARLGLAVRDIDVLVTNQPNRIFLRNWREALGLPKERHLDTFDRFGNLYGAGVAITLDHAAREGLIADGALVVVAGFAHAGDFAAAAALRWRGLPGTVGPS